MKRSEWIEIVAQMLVNWPHSPIPESSIGKWYEDLKHLSTEQVRVGVEAIYRDCREHAPNGAQILAKVSELTRDDVDHGEAWALAKKASLKAIPEEGFAWLQDRSPAAAEAVRRLCGPQLTYLLADETTARAQFREIYKAVCAERKRDDAYAGLPDAGLRGLQRGPRQLGQALKRALPEGVSG